MTSPHIWLRAESKPKEERTALTPNDARRLLTAGFQVTVERSPLRAFEDEGYERVGCALAPTGSWLSKAPAEAFILGLKELPDADFELGHRHIYFAHVFKNQVGWQRTLKRFAAGGGVLLDLEYLTDSEGRRVSAFGHWAGFVGAGVGAGIWAHRKLHGDAEAIPALRSWPSQEQCVAELREQVEHAVRAAGGTKPTALVIGAKGRCGKGAAQCLERLGFQVTGWDMAETSAGGPFPQILNFDVFVNCVLVTSALPPFLTQAELALPRRLSVIADVSCDPNGPYNPLPIYSDHTNFAHPATVVARNPLMELVAIDHLPSLLPRESSEDFSSQLLPHLLTLGTGSDVWERALRIYREKTEHLMGAGHA